MITGSNVHACYGFTETLEWSHVAPSTWIPPLLKIIFRLEKTNCLQIQVLLVRPKCLRPSSIVHPWKHHIELVTDSCGHVLSPCATVEVTHYNPWPSKSKNHTKFGSSCGTWMCDCRLQNARCYKCSAMLSSLSRDEWVRSSISTSWPWEQPKANPGQKSVFNRLLNQHCGALAKYTANGIADKNETK